ncbi:MAG: hypothetical protein WDM89_17650 [Rhizomicrobium sp.]
MNYVEEHRALTREVANYAAGGGAQRRTASSWFRDTTEERRRYAERRIAKLEEYFQRHGIVVNV